MTIVRRYWMALSIVAANVVLAALWYDRLPRRVPIHWNLAGVPDVSIEKPAGAFALPALALVIVAVQILAAPQAVADAPGESSMGRVYPTLVATMSALFLWMTVGAVAGLTSATLSVGLGMLLMIFGNYLGKTTRTFVLGVRTPWSLASDELWSRTQRVAGRLYVLAGLITIMAGTFVGMTTLMASGLTAAIYSHVIWRRGR